MADSIIVDGEIVLYGFVGDSFWDEGFTAKQVLDALAELGRDSDITVRINSGGGYTDDGKAIYNALSAHKGRVTVMVDAVAASSASLIAMAGDEIIMRNGALMMIHDPATFTVGTVEDHEKTIELLKREAGSFASIYSDRSKKTVDECRSIMRAETWYTADEAVAAGFADKKEKARASAVAAFDYSLYQHAPKSALALAKKHAWNFQEAKAAASAVAPNQTKEIEMGDKTQADVDKAASEAAAAATARIGEILGAEEAKGRETLAQHFAFKTTMSADDAKVALAAAPKGAAETTAAKPGKTGEQTYAERKAAAGADSVVDDENDRAKAAARAKAGWKSAVGLANASIGGNA